MIRGLEHFQNYFKEHSSSFILIGGVASYLLLDEAGAPKVRATKDLDIVIMMKPTEDFLVRIKQYIKEGGYEIQKGDNDQSSFYRFQKPTDDEFPLMLEFFASAEANFNLFPEQHIIPISSSEGVESLSAILLDKEYFSIIKSNTVVSGGINILNPVALIPLKAKAYLEIKERKEDSRNWKKHRSDIINLAVTFLDDKKEEKLSGKVKEHFLEFMKQLKQEITNDVIKGACGQKIPSDKIITLLEKTFLAGP